MRVNQLGYLPTAPKRAVVVSSAEKPLPWELVDASGARVANGVTVPRGRDGGSGDDLHTIDFSSFNSAGKRYVLRVAGMESPHFDVDARLFRPLKYDALAYFYQNRSGIPIEMPYAGNARWTRPAGHLGDAQVTCLPSEPCRYSLDASAGWYDAGDHGKYVVNGAFTAWLLLDQYERATQLGWSARDFADGTMNIPERANGAPDLLDEARWELTFLLGMQVPPGQPLAGMVHHKVHDAKWTKVPTAPHEDKEPRHLHPPSTAATLNLAAVAAQCARVYPPIDAAFASRCLTAAERAWAAAISMPTRHALATDSVGGGPYDDSDTSDELYWAAVELFLTTGRPVYHEALLRSPHRFAARTNEQGAAFTWQNTRALGTISLAVVPRFASPEEMGAARRSIQLAADAFLASAEKSGYRVPLTEAKCAWGSNSEVLENAVMAALAHDFTREPKYLAGVVDALDYVLGRNANGRSFVTGYGELAAQHPHHRFWADQADARFPAPPPGALVGGPNSGLEDPFARRMLSSGCAAQKCWVDHVESWSTNEVAINWNGVLAWVAAFVDEKSAPPSGF